MQEILVQYPNLPRKFLVKFALSCANDIKHLLKDERSIEALESTELWLENKISQEDMKKVVDKAYRAANIPSESISYAALTTYYAACVAYNNIYASYVCSVVYCTLKALGVSEDVYKDKLLEMIDELTELEKLVYLK